MAGSEGRLPSPLATLAWKRSAPPRLDLDHEGQSSHLQGGRGSRRGPPSAQHSTALKVMTHQLARAAHLYSPRTLTPALGTYACEVKDLQ